MNIDMDMLTPILIALIGAGGLWQPTFSESQAGARGTDARPI